MHLLDRGVEVEGAQGDHRPAQPQGPIDLGEGEEPVRLQPLLSPAASGMKAFIVNRIGDVGFALGVFLIWSTFGTLQFTGVFEQAHHVAEAAFKSVARALRVALEPDPRQAGAIPSTKGTL